MKQAAFEKPPKQYRVGRRLRDSTTLVAMAMRRRGLSIADLAERVEKHGVGVSTVRRIVMADDGYLPRVLTAEAVAQAVTSVELPIDVCDIMLDCGAEASRWHRANWLRKKALWGGGDDAAR